MSAEPPRNQESRNPQQRRDGAEIAAGPVPPQHESVEEAEGR